ncbi:hypothetical protein GDO81_027845 [Engystomops pustulosus]|uniref:Uncharacterized protein n=1 Tax=Engystomops pustulosus TaxID=76066 RepID=A0AAV6ZE52_ENGPU|nr:hypothetical protein GDO81_027845 [Engystomops pustulosus]
MYRVQELALLVFSFGVFTFVFFGGGGKFANVPENSDLYWNVFVKLVALIMVG